MSQGAQKHRGRQGTHMADSRKRHPDRAPAKAFPGEHLPCGAGVKAVKMTLRIPVRVLRCTVHIIGFTQEEHFRIAQDLGDD